MVLQDGAYLPQDRRTTRILTASRSSIKVAVVIIIPEIKDGNNRGRGERGGEGLVPVWRGGGRRLRVGGAHEQEGEFVLLLLFILLLLAVCPRTILRRVLWRGGESDQHTTDGRHKKEHGP